MDIKFCTNIFCLNNEVYLKYILSMMKSKLNLLIVSSKYNQAGRNILNLSSILFLSERSEIRIMPKIYLKQLNLWIRGWHSITNMNRIPWELTLQIVASRPIFAPQKSNCHCFRIMTAWCLAFPGIDYRVTYIPLDITKHVLICMM